MEVNSGKRTEANRVARVQVQVEGELARQLLRSADKHRVELAGESADRDVDRAVAVHQRVDLARGVVTVTRRDEL